MDYNEEALQEGKVQVKGEEVSARYRCAPPRKLKDRNFRPKTRSKVS